MKTYDELKASYLQQAQAAEQAAEKLQQQIYRISTLRLLLFAAGVAALLYWHAEAWWVLVGITLVTLVPFVALMKLHDRLFSRKDYLEKEAEVNRQEVAALDYDTSAFDDGAEFTDPSHLYTFDLDVFGPHSLFQYINRTCTEPGRRRLAEWLGCHLEEKAAIEARQQAVQELCQAEDFRRRFRITGLLYKGKAADEKQLTTWAESPSYFRPKRWMRALPVVVTGTNAVCLALTVAGIMPGAVWGTIWALFLGIACCFTGRISRVQSLYGKRLQVLGTYARLLRLMDEQPMHSALLKDIKAQIGDNGPHNASEAIRRLDRLMHELDQRNNYLMYVVLNGTFFWELWQMMRIEAWKEQHATQLPRWLAAIGQTDALCSLAAFAYNHPDYTFPTLLGNSDNVQPTAGNGTTSQAPTPFRLCGEALGHPLMHRDRCVRNDIHIEKRPFFIIITGANMAGKSTYLRTVGVNYLLACIGAPVCAQHMELYPARLVTSLRTSDSLTDNESYFFAELKRLKLIIDKLQAGEELFIILDEILKGTNSMDKQKGSFALIEQLMVLQADGIIATHDLLLGTLADHFPDDIRNFRFEADITDDELTFSYRMQPGVAQNMNACFLMKKMGIAF